MKKGNSEGIFRDATFAIYPSTVESKLQEKFTQDVIKKLCLTSRKMVYNVFPIQKTSTRSLNAHNVIIGSYILNT